MSQTGIGKIFKNGRSQAIRLPKEFRFEGDKVCLKRVGKGVLIEPIPLKFDAEAWFAELDRLNTGNFMEDGREQPPTPERKIFD
jgi:antitoxin VapB